MREEKHHLNLSMYQIRRERDVLARIIRILRPLSQAKRRAVLGSVMLFQEAEKADTANG